MGSPQPVSLSVDLPGEEEVFAPRQTRLLPLSGKTDEALRDLTGRYLSWLDELASEDKDLACRHGVDSGRGDVFHFDHRAGIVFQDIESLRKEVTGTLRNRRKTRAARSDKDRFPRTPDRTASGSAWGKTSTKASR